MFSAESKIVKAKGAKPDQFEETVASAIYDLQVRGPVFLRCFWVVFFCSVAVVGVFQSIIFLFACLVLSTDAGVCSADELGQAPPLPARGAHHLGQGD